MKELLERFPRLGDWKTYAELRDLQDTLRWDTLKQARQSPFYEAHCSDTAPTETDWKRLPFTMKADLRKAYPFGLLAVKRSELVTYHESSGTTGEPTASFFTALDWADVISRFNRNAVGLTSEDTVMIKTPYALVTTAHQMQRAAEAAGALVIPADNRSSNMPYAKVVRLLKDLSPTVAWCMPTESLLWAASAEEHGLDPSVDFPRFRAFLVAGEPLSWSKRQRIQEIWGNAKVFEDYGSTETGSLGGECAYGNMHLWADRFLPEILKGNGDTDRSGRGQLVITTLFRRAMPLVRYQLEDEVELLEGECPCGWQLPTIRVLGRTSSFIEGREVFPSDLEDLVYSLPLECGVMFWRARHDDLLLDVEVETAPGFEEKSCELLKQKIVNRFRIRSFVSAVPKGTLVSKALLTQSNKFLKPRFLFSAKENWDGGLNY